MCDSAFTALRAVWRSLPGRV